MINCPKSDIKYSTSDDKDIIVSQLTEILDYVDSIETSFTHDYYINIVCGCHLCLVEKTNKRLLPYLHIIRRYKNEIETSKMARFLEESFRQYGKFVNSF
tara:strand:- start:4859 stop:5158 length:300 start_codon:yes stop_codon:yes gene_type:complete